MPVLALAAVVFVAALAFLSRALHLDGFMDTCDALLGGSSPQERRRILKDPHVGAFAVVGVICLFLFKVAGVWLLVDHTRVNVLVLAPCVSRWAVLLAMDAFPYAGGDGLGAALLQKPGHGQLAFGSTFTIITGFCLCGGWGLALIVLAGVVAWSLGAAATKMLGGTTGDIYGAVNETTETATLLLAAFLVSWIPSGLRSPLVGFAGL
jgi:adenosylcobinamide-GDP ribazoletransferase